MQHPESTAERCTAKSKSTGERCAAFPVKGLTVCHKHGGASKRARAAGAARTEMAKQRKQAEKAVARFRPSPQEVSVAETLLDLVAYQSGMVAYWRERVEQLEDGNLTWGTTKIEEGERDHGEVNVRTKEATPNVAYRLLVEAQRDLADYVTRALKANVDERRVRVAEQTGAIFVVAIRGILEDLSLTVKQQRLVATVVPKHLRAISQNQGEVRSA